MQKYLQCNSSARHIAGRQWPHDGNYDEKSWTPLQWHWGSALCVPKPWARPCPQTMANLHGHKRNSIALRGIIRQQAPNQRGLTQAPQATSTTNDAPQTPLLCRVSLESPAQQNNNTTMEADESGLNDLALVHTSIPNSGIKTIERLNEFLMW